MEHTTDFDSKYRYILVAARRARQIQSGANALVDTPSRKACRIARDEIQAGKVKYVVLEKPATVPVVAAPEETED
jgi:DNA-directed RNA polymerase subunit omega